MTAFVARRIKFRNGERLSVLQRHGGLPVHEVTLFLNTFRRRGRAANTIHAVCGALGLLYREFDKLGVDLLAGLASGRFPSASELERLADATQYPIDALDENEGGAQPSVIDIHSVRRRRQSAKRAQPQPVDVGTQATRLRYMAQFLEFLVGYVGPELSRDKRHVLEEEALRTLTVFRAHIPSVSRRSKLGAREGVSSGEQDKLLEVVHPDSPKNPWKRSFVRQRNWLIVVLLLASGMRRGELLGLQIGDLIANQPKLRIIRRADSNDDARRTQPNTKTYDREIELNPEIMRRLWRHIQRDRRAIKSARSIPQIFVSDEGEALSLASIDKIFKQIREACPEVTARLTSHVMRHTWNDRFSEQAQAMGLSDKEEGDARKTQQGWSDRSDMGAVYTRRHTAAQGRAVSLELQKRLDDKLN